MKELKQVKLLIERTPSSVVQQLASAKEHNTKAEYALLKDLDVPFQPTLLSFENWTTLPNRIDTTKTYWLIHDPKMKKKNTLAKQKAANQVKH